MLPVAKTLAPCLQSREVRLFSVLYTRMQQSAIGCLAAKPIGIANEESDAFLDTCEGKSGVIQVEENDIGASC